MASISFIIRVSTANAYYVVRFAEEYSRRLGYHTRIVADEESYGLIISTGDECFRLMFRRTDEGSWIAAGDFETENTRFFGDVYRILRSLRVKMRFIVQASYMELTEAEASLYQEPQPHREERREEKPRQTRLTEMI